jgi:septal ring-binding cell division protein DamX
MPPPRMQLPDDHQMQHHKKGTLLMLDSSLREHPSPAPDLKGTPANALNGDKKTHKKQKHAKYRAEVAQELARISEALRQLRVRVSDLHALHLDREGRGAALTARLDALGKDQAAARERTGALDRQVEDLSVKVDALRAEAAVITDTLADLAVEPDRDTALFALEDRIQEAEDTLTGLQALAEQSAAQEGLMERLDGLVQEVAAQSERVAGLETRAAGEDRDSPDAAHLEQLLGTLGASVDERVQGMERDLATLRDQNKRWREAERGWAEERMGGLGRWLAGAVAVLGVLLVAGLAAIWWHGERQLDLIAARIAAVERDTGERLSALAVAVDRPDDEVRAVLGQLEQAMQVMQASNAEFGARLAALADSHPGPASGAPDVADIQARLRVLEASRDAPATVEPETAPAGAATPVGTPAQTRAEDNPAVPDQTGPQAVGASAESSASAEAAGGEVQVVASPIEAPDSRSAVAPAASLPAQGSTQAGETQATTGDSATSPAAAVAPAERYALQLIGFRSQASIGPFTREHDIAAAARWLRAPARGRDWYLVLFGDYATRQEAEAALDNLPDGLRRLSPVVRPLAAEAQPVEAQPVEAD